LRSAVAIFGLDSSEYDAVREGWAGVGIDV